MRNNVFIRGPLYLSTGATILIVLLHGIPAILMSYLFSFWAKTPASGFSILTIIGVISGKIRNAVSKDGSCGDTLKS